jgi:hypothetical protein
MTLIRHIITPSELLELRLPPPTPETTTTPQTIEIHLLFPLATEHETFHESKRNSTTLALSHDKCLDISHLCKRWRYAWSQLSPNTVERVIFNVALPDLPEPSVSITEGPRPPPAPVAESSAAAAEREAA